MEPEEHGENERIEIALLLEAVYLKYGYDFRNYARASIRRRIRKRLAESGLSTIAEMQHRVIHDLRFFETLLLDLTISVTEMFRDPPFFRALREVVLPALREQAFLKIWHAGCATGEEVYSLAILLMEEKMNHQARIYATDANETVLQAARKGVYPISRMKAYTRNYQLAGGKGAFSDYYTCRYDHVILSAALKRNIVFADHNLVTDGVFGEMDLILCRNVLIYFNSDLQERVIRLFRDSLRPGGFLCLGTKETLRFTGCADDFVSVVDACRIFQKR